MKSLTLILSVAILSLIVSCQLFTSSKVVRKKTELAKDRQQEIAVAVMSLWVDDCGGIVPEPDVDIPNRLTTPISYTSSEFYQDPFGSKGERFLFLPEKYFANSGVFAIISRGPDGDLDSASIEYRKNFKEMKPSEEVPALPTLEDIDLNNYEEKYLNWFQEQGIFQYDPSNGLRSDGDIIRLYR